MINKKRKERRLDNLIFENKVNSVFRKNNSRYFIISLIILSILFSIYPIFAQTTDSTQNQVSFCCEKTVSGAYCQNAPKEQCDTSFRSTPTSCAATSFCQPGCCYDSNQGICMQNIPQEACKASNGVWSDSATCQIPQCDLGCCVLGQQAAYVPLARCNKLASIYGLQTDFRKDVSDELSCINLAQAQDVGACVYESDFATTCKFTTRGACDGSKLNSVTNGTSVGFHKDYLCTAPELNTNCEPLDKTECVPGKDGVYFIDSCGNPGNIFDASKIWSKSKSNPETIDYWTKVKQKEQSCGSGGNVDSKSCGNCDYLSGSVCSSADKNNKPVYGDFICKDINCYSTSNGKDYKNGESWCYYDSGKADSDSVGSRGFRHVCANGEELVEPCADFKQQVCVEDSIGGFSQAGCVVNRWQDCLLINKSADCLNTDKRDCEWISLDPKDMAGGKAGLTGRLTKQTSDNQIWNSVLSGATGSLKSTVSTKKEIGRCVPKITPGIQFWDQSSEAQCKLGSQSCVVTFEKGLFGQAKCVKNCECLTQEAKYTANKICSSIGDCGANSNYIGKFTDKGYEITVVRGNEQNVSSGGGADKSNGQNAPASSQSQTFGGSQTQNFQGAQGAGPTTSTSAPSSTGTGSVIQGLVIGTYNKIVKTGGK